MGAVENILLALGGLALLLFGIKMVSSGLEVVAGDRLQIVLKRATSNRFLAAIVGVLATVVISSSTAVSVITVGFVNAGLMNLTQAIGVLLGINVGTTFTAHLIAFRIDAYAPIFIFIGVALYLFVKKRNIRNIGYAVLGFGILFFSITVMGDALRVFRDHPAFMYMITAIANPLFALLVGFIFTVAVQSSSATMAMLVTLHLNDVPIPFQTSAFIILGANIGTSVTAMIASIPASRDSRRAALFHITYSVIGSIAFGTLILILPGILVWFQTTWSESAQQVAMFHTLFNVATLILLIPFVTLLAKLMQTIIPVKKDEAVKIHERRLLFLDSIPNAKVISLVPSAHKEICRMGKIANENLALALESFFEKSDSKANKAIENEKTVNFLNHKITEKLVEISSKRLPPGNARKLGRMFKILTDIERIGDHAENIAEYALMAKEDNLKFSEDAIKELQELSDITLKVAAKALDVYENRDKPKAKLSKQLKAIEDLEEKVDELCKTFANNHTERLKAKTCEPKSGVIFIDMISDLERIADHAENIAESM